MKDHKIEIHRSDVVSHASHMFVKI